MSLNRIWKLILFALAAAALVWAGLWLFRAENEAKIRAEEEKKTIRDYFLEQEYFELEVGETADLNVRIEPETADRSTLIFQSLDEDILAVDAEGHVKTLRPGYSRIYVKTGTTVKYAVFKVVKRLKGLSFEIPEYTLERGAEVRPTVVMTPADHTDDVRLTYESTDESIVTVDPDGLIHAVENGSADVIVRGNDYQAICRVHVETSIQSITLGLTNIMVRLGDTIQVPIGYEPADATEKLDLQWESSDETIVTVDEEGLLTAKTPGTATVHVSRGDFSGEIAVHVVIPVTSVAISTGNIVLNKGTTGQLYASAQPVTATEPRTVSFASDNPRVATVNGAGVITAVAPGVAHIRAYHDAVGAVCTVTVLSPLEAIAMNAENVELIETMETTLSLSYFPADTTEAKNPVWTSDRPDVLEVLPGGVIRALTTGNATVTATLAGKTATCNVTVLPYVYVESVTLNVAEHTFTERGATLALQASILPLDATVGSATFVSSHPEIASVDGNGVVKALTNGDAVITAKAGDKEAAVLIHVNCPEPDKVVVLDPGHAARFPGASYFGIREEFITLTTALACKEYLETHYTGVVVYLTRTDMNPLDNTSNKRDLEARAQFAQDHDADILVSMHYNATAQHNASGSLCFVSKDVNVAAASRDLANHILAVICANTGLRNRGAASSNSNRYVDEFGNPLDNYAINRHTAARGIPAVIVEHCFMDCDYAFVSTEDKIRAFGIYDAIGIANYLGLQPK